MSFLAALALAAGCQREGERSAGEPVSERRHLVRDILADPKTFNPVLTTDSASADAIEYLFEALVRRNPMSEEMEPLLAERWERNEDGTEWTFHLRRDVRWHDQKPLTAADVRFSFQAIYDERVPNSSKHVLTIDGQPVAVEVVDAHTVRFTLPRPFAPFLSALGGVAIIPEHVLGASLKAGTFTQQWGIDAKPEQIVGTGPYRMARYVPAQFVQLRRNPDYWMRDEAGQPLPYLEEQTILILQNQDTELLKFLSGNLDLLVPRPEDVPDLQQQADRLGIAVSEIGLDTGALFVVFNRNPNHYHRDGRRDPRLTWFTDKMFLRALAHAVDARSMLQNCFNGFGEPAVAYISPENRLFHNPNLKPYEYDLDTARRLLAEGGYIDRDGDGVIEDREGHPVEFTLHTNAGNQVREKMCSILKEDWTKLGIRVHYRPLDWTLLTDKLDVTFDWDAVLIGFTGGLEPNDAVNLLRSSGNLHLWHPHQPSPATPWEAEIDRLLEEGTRQLDPEQRRYSYWRIQEILHEELPMIMTVHQKRFRAFNRRLENYRPTPWGIYRPELIRFR